jgi:curved DNA-binding protein CbpA
MMRFESFNGNPESHYVLLGISEHASANEIKQAFKLQARKVRPQAPLSAPTRAEMAILQCHPDKNVGHEEQAASMFRRVKAAFEVLADPRSRELYDAARRAASAPFSTVPDPADDVDSDEWANASDENGSVGSVDSAEWAECESNSVDRNAAPIDPSLLRKEEPGVPATRALNSAIQIARAKAKAETDDLFSRARLEAEAAEAAAAEH